MAKKKYDYNKAYTVRFHDEVIDSYINKTYESKMTSYVFTILEKKYHWDKVYQSLTNKFEKNFEMVLCRDYFDYKTVFSDYMLEMGLQGAQVVVYRKLKEVLN